MRKNKEGLIEFLGYYQIIGGALGIAFIIILFIQNVSDINSISWVLSIMPFFFAFSLYCGIACLKKRRNFLNLSLFNQFLQLVYFTISGYTYYFFSGVRLNIGVDLTTSTKLKFGFGFSDMILTFGNGDDVILVGVNLVALYLIYRMLEYKEATKELPATINNTN